MLNPIAVGLLQAIAVVSAVAIALWITFQIGLRAMYHLKWKHD